MVDEGEAQCEEFLAALSESVRKRVANIPPPGTGDARVAVLFSGGVDCTLLAYMIHLYVHVFQYSPDRRCLPQDEPIDLLNVAFQQPRTGEVSGSPYNVPDRASGKDAYEELSKCCPSRTFRFIEVDVPLDVSCAQVLLHTLLMIQESRRHRQEILDLIYPSDTGEQCNGQARILI